MKNKSFYLWGGLGIIFIIVIGIIVYPNISLNKLQDQITSEDGSKIYSDVGGFVTINAMLDKRIDELFFPGTHNSFSNNKNADHDYVYSYSTGTLNQDLGIKQSLEKGLRYIDIDLGRQDSKDHTQSYHRVRKIKVGALGLKWMGNTSVFVICNEIKDFLEANPKEVVFLNISDIYKDADAFNLSDNAVLKNQDWEYYTHINRFLRILLRDKGMASKTFNYYGSADTDEKEMYKYILGPGMTYNSKSMSEWPYLREMINQNKRLIILLPSNRLNVDDENTIRRMTTTGSHYLYKGSDESKGGSGINTADRINPFNISSGTSNDKKLFLVHEWPDGGASAGWRESSRINNEGRRLYQLIKGYDVKFNKAEYANFVDLDFFQPNSKKGGLSTLDVDAVDAANRINFENCGYNWSSMKSINSNYYWSDYKEDTNRISSEHMKISVDGAKENPWPYRSYHDSYIFGKGPQALLDANMWSGYDKDSDINGKPFRINLDKVYMINKVALNFIPNSNEDVSIKITIASKEGDQSYITRWFGKGLNREVSWYVFELPGNYPTKDVYITLGTSKGGKQFKEVALYGTEAKGSTFKDSMCIADAYVKRGDPYGHHNYNNDKIEVSWDEGHEHRRYGYVKFNIANISSVENATLRLHAHNVQSDAAPIAVYGVNKDDWEESSVTWDKIRNYTGDYINQFTVEDDGWYEIDVTSYIKSKVSAGKDIVTMQLAIPSGNKDDVEFKSKEVSGYAPRLNILN